MQNCLLCGHLNPEGFHRCELCKTPPAQALQTLTEGKHWYEVVLFTVLALTLAGSVALNIYLTSKTTFRSNIEFTLTPAQAANSTQSRLSDREAASLQTVGGNQYLRFAGDVLVLLLWLPLSVAFIGGSLWAAKRATLWMAMKIVRARIERQIARQEYRYPGLHFPQAHAHARGSDHSGWHGTV